MKRSDQKQLRNELQLAGATDADINELLPLAIGLSRLKTPADRPVRPSRQEWWPKVLRLAGVAFVGLVAGLVLIVFAQGVLPGSPLYPIQKLSDSIAATVHPPYRASVMMHRAQQVNALVAAHADSAIILATLHDYTTTAKVYQASSHTSYAAFEYCKASLQQAAAAASPSIRQAIQGSLKPLEDV